MKNEYLTDETEYEDETDLLPSMEECDRRHDYREFFLNHAEDGESIDTEPNEFFSWSRVPYTDITDRRQKTRVTARLTNATMTLNQKIKTYPNYTKWISQQYFTPSLQNGN